MTSCATRRTVRSSPDAVLDPSSQSTENWNLTRGGGYLAAGVGTGITGRGAHVLLLDDLVKDIEAADSITIRDNTWEWYLSTAYTRLAPGGGRDRDHVHDGRHPRDDG